MNTKFSSLAVFALTLILSACSPFTITSSSGQQPTPVIVSEPATDYQPLQVDSVEVEVGVGSPIPVHVNVSGSLPDTCSQIEYTEIKQDGSNFIVTLSAVSSGAENCVQDTPPFSMSIPLNVLDLPAGDYAATVNGSRANFKLGAGTSTSDLRTADMPIVKRDIQVDSVNVEVGVGSPIPVKAIVSANLPNSCSQLGEVRLHRDGTTFFVQLVAYIPAQTDCNPDTLPIRVEVPLNIVNLPEGPYQVNVNGATASFDPLAKPALIPAGWATHTNTSQRCEYAISYPAEMQVTDENPYSQTLGFKPANSDEGARNFVYVSVIGSEIQSMVQEGVYNNDVYNYDPAVAEVLLHMQVGESKPVYEFPNVESGFTYQRKPDTLISGHAAQTYENVQPWEFPEGTKEIRYYQSLNECTYLIGGYVNTTQSNQPGAITEELFNQVVAAIRLIP